MPTRQTKGCVGCIYYSQQTGSCDYILIENERRNAPAIRGKGCAKKRKGERNVAKKTWKPQRVFPADQAQELYALGLSDVKIAKQVGWSAFSVARWRRENNLPTTCELGRPPCRPEDYKNGIPFQRWKEGKTDTEIAREVGVHKSTISNWRMRNNLASNYVRGKAEKEEPMEEKMNEQATDKLVAEETAEAPKSGTADTPVAPDAPSCERVAEELAWIWEVSTGEQVSAEKAASLLELVDIAWRIAAGDCRGAIRRVLNAERRSRA